MKKILIVGGSHSEIPLVKAAKELELYTITTGNQKEGLAHKYSDEFHLCDYSKPKNIYKLFLDLKVDYICFGAHDFSYLSTVYVADKLNFSYFDSLETAKTLHHKDEFKEFCEKNNIITVKAKSFNNLKLAIEYANTRKLPFMVKPIDLGGGKGILKIINKNQIEKAIQDAFKYSKSKRIIIEDFFEGSLHSFSTFIINQKIEFYFEDTELPCKNNPYGVCTSISPSINFEAIKIKLINEIEKISKLLNLKNGLLHCQYLRNKNEFSIIELTRRMPGDFYNIPVEISTNFQYAKNIIRQCTGEKLDLSHNKQNKFTSRHCIIGEYRSLLNINLGKNIEYKIIWNRSQNIQKQGILFLKYNSFDEMINKTKLLVQSI